MRLRLLGIVAALAASLALAAPASAINYDDCENTLRGNAPHVGYHGFDNDVKRVWNYYEGTYGINIVSSHRYRAWHPGDNPYSVGIGMVYTRANGSTIGHALHCWDGRPFGAAYQDESWYRLW
jgi:hypothetical protein